MITNFIVDEIDAKVLERKKIDSFTANLSVKGAMFDSNTAAIYFVWSVDYAPNCGYIKLAGRAVFAEPKEKLAQMQEEWETNRCLPPGLVGEFTNSINYFCVINSAVILKPMDFLPPLRMQPIVAKED